MRKIQLSNGLETIIDDEDYDWATQFKWHAARGRGDDFYAYRAAKIPLENGRFRYSSRQMQRDLIDPERILPGSILVDHKNHNTLDNRRSNLRTATFSQSNANRTRPVGKSGIRGIQPTSRGAYIIVVSKDKKRFYGKRQYDADSAIQEYNRLAYKLYGEFSVLHSVTKDDLA